MERKHAGSHHIDSFEVGSIVSLLIPKADLPPGVTQKRIECCVLQCLRGNQYCLQTTTGILKNVYPTRELNRVPPEAASRFLYL